MKFRGKLVFLGVTTLVLFAVCFWEEVLQVERAGAVEVLDGSTTKRPLGTPSDPDLRNVTLEESCWRHCRLRNNLIAYTGAGGKAGLMDRQTIFKYLANVAGYLCARVYVPDPTSLLDPYHNHGKPVDPLMVWEDYFLMEWAWEGSTTSTNATRNRPLLVKDKDRLRAWSAKPPTDETTFSLQTTEPKMVDRDSWKHFRQLEDFVFKTQEQLQQNRELQPFNEAAVDDITIHRFHWLIETNFWDLSLFRVPEDEVFNLSESTRRPSRLHHAFPSGVRSASTNTAHSVETLSWHSQCQYVEFRTPPLIQSFRDDLLGELQRTFRQSESPGKQTLIGWHIRRADGVEECATAIDFLVEFVRCSLEGTEDWGAMRLLVMTDDGGDDFRKKLEKGITSSMPSVEVLWLDTIVEHAIQVRFARGQLPRRFRADNYFLFAILESLQAGLDFQWEHRRTLSCPNCSKLVGNLS